jgi:hypothetical protein
MNSGADVETYYENGVWKNRRLDCDQPFSTGGSMLRQLAEGAEVARWNGARHIVRDTDGAIVETNIYGSGPYPHRSPIKTVRQQVESP